MKKTIYLSRLESNEIKLCDHISIEGIESTEEEVYPEYINHLLIKCHICDVKHHITILI